MLLRIVYDFLSVCRPKTDTLNEGRLPSGRIRGESFVRDANQDIGISPGAIARDDYCLLAHFHASTELFFQPGEHFGFEFAEVYSARGSVGLVASLLFVFQLRDVAVVDRR